MLNDVDIFEKRAFAAGASANATTIISVPNNKIFLFILFFLPQFYFYSRPSTDTIANTTIRISRVIPIFFLCF